MGDGQERLWERNESVHSIHIRVMCTATQHRTSTILMCSCLKFKLKGRYATDYSQVFVFKKPGNVQGTKSPIAKNISRAHILEVSLDPGWILTLRPPFFSCRKQLKRCAAKKRNKNITKLNVKHTFSYAFFFFSARKVNHASALGLYIQKAFAESVVRGRTKLTGKHSTSRHMCTKPNHILFISSLTIFYNRLQLFFTIALIYQHKSYCVKALARIFPLFH